jgi:hypothetical protein
VPLPTFVTLMHVDVPVAQDVVPTVQLVGLQPTLAVQEEQLPLSQTRFVPHEVPLPTFVTLTHVDVPVAHDVVPIVQFVGLQPTLAVQEAQVPPLQTMLVPHDVPLPTFATFVHIDVPVAHDVVPAVQLEGLQVTPAVQGEQLPLLHTWLVPHGVPLATLATIVQVDVPDAQDVVPA